MTIRAEVTAAGSSHAVVSRLGAGVAHLNVGDARLVKLDVPASEIVSYERRGDDLVIVLANGQRLILDDYFRTDGDGHPRLLLSGDSGGAVSEVGFAGDAPQGALAPSSGSGPASGGLGTIGMAALGLAAVGGLVAAVSSGGGDDDNGKGPGHETDIDPVILYHNSREITGRATPGARVEIDVNGDGRPDYTVYADADGNWRKEFSPPLPDGTPVKVEVVDPDGTRHQPVDTRVDGTPPPQAVIEHHNAHEISGRGEPGGKVEIDTNGDGKPDYVADIDQNGNWRQEFNPPLGQGDRVTVVIKDSAGNISEPKFTFVDTTVPPSAQVDPTNGRTIHGKAEPGSTVVIHFGDGRPDITANVDPNGNWSANINPALPNGAPVTVTVISAAGNSSLPTTVDADALAPSAAELNPSNGSAITGEAEPGSTVHIHTNDGRADATATVGADGRWSHVFDPQLANGTEITVTVEDPAGNLSEPTKEIVDTAVFVLAVLGITPDTGVSDHDGITDSSELTFHGTGTRGAVVEILLDGDHVIGSA
ncbi:MAG: Ig-like domain-containing protein, partial [Brucella intermedia]